MTRTSPCLRLGIPKGRIQAEVVRLLADAGIELRAGVRDYRPLLGLDDAEAKILKPQSIAWMLADGSRDLGFTGADWVAEHDLSLVELLDTGLNPVRLVAAGPSGALDAPAAGLRVASEYMNLAARWIETRELNARVVRSWGATEVYPPEDADLIVDNTSSGATLAANGLVVFDELLRSSTRLYASQAALDDPEQRGRIEDLVLLLRSVLEARRRVMVELNVDAASLERIVAELPCMREVTVSGLHGGSGYAVKAAVPKAELPALLPRLKARGGSDLVVSPFSQIVP